MALLVGIWEFLVYLGGLLTEFWAVLVRFLPFLGRIGPWLAGLLPLIPAFFRKIIEGVTGLGASEILKGVYALTARIMVLTAYGIFLATLSTGLAGLGIRDIFFSNPFSGFPAAMMFLVCAAFPVKFALGLVSSYIIFRATVYTAALVLTRTVKFIFGG